MGFLFLGTDVGIKTVYASMLMSFSLSALDRFVPLAGTITDQPMLELIFAIFLPAVGSAVLFNIGASSGGTDIIAMILKAHSSMNIGTGTSGGGYYLCGYVLFCIRTDYRTVFLAGTDGEVSGN